MGVFCFCWCLFKYQARARHLEKDSRLGGVFVVGVSSNTAMGQNPRTPIPAKMGGAPTPKWGSHW